MAIRLDKASGIVAIQVDNRVFVVCGHSSAIRQINNDAIIAFGKLAASVYELFAVQIFDFSSTLRWPSFRNFGVPTMRPLLRPPLRGVYRGASGPINLSSASSGFDRNCKIVLGGSLDVLSFPDRDKMFLGMG